MPVEFRPWTTRTVGIEMEISTGSRSGGRVSAEAIARGFRAMGLQVGSNVGSYYHSNGQTWDVKSDSSCGWEISTPAIRMDESMDNEELRKACRYLKDEVEAKVTTACGLHVHVDCSDMTWRELQGLMTLWVRYEPFFWDMQPDSRKHNTYCMPYGRTAWDMVHGSHPLSTAWLHVREALAAGAESTFQRNARRLERRMSLNISGWWSHGRVEFRLGAGTVDYDKVRRWASLLAALCTRASEARRGRLFLPVKNVTNWSSSTGLDTKYVLKALGLWASDRVAADPMHRDLLDWCEARRRRFAATEVRRPGQRVSDSPPPGVTGPWLAGRARRSTLTETAQELVRDAVPATPEPASAARDERSVINLLHEALDAGLVSQSVVRGEA